ncbi:hypothetical protein [Uliginosibacterium sp. TH139]|uniref:hypothetical protein n=1 Tax=Uliginosibacterium sp. TH139 TaxID=2067453 RepID=UPI000C7E7720|nr:hypothetical protein [Uliginosibacterium sp. TH139]PLK50916.1 hypothetical protein C0V76_03700 [Uliginosibacterium sp. TH139]
MSSQSPSPLKDKSTIHEGLIACGAFIIMVALMVASYFYPYPSGERPDFLSLFMLWGREAVLVALAIVFVVMFATVAVIKAVKKCFRAKPDA